jgi:hypothetical protein
MLEPLFVCAYSIVIWRLYPDLVFSEGPLTFELRGVGWIFYSWFVAGVIGLGPNPYGLAGVEVSMMIERIWNVGDATKLMLHANNTSSGPGG